MILFAKKRLTTQNVITFNNHLSIQLLTHKAFAISNISKLLKAKYKINLIIILISVSRLLKNQKHLKINNNTINR